MFWYSMIVARFYFDHSLIYSLSTGTLVFCQTKTNARTKRMSVTRTLNATILSVILLLLLLVMLFSKLAFP